MIIKSKFAFGHDAAFICLIPPFPTLTLITPEYANHGPLLNHERWHLEQYQKEPFTFGIKMLFDDNYRFEKEAEAYAIQLKTHRDIGGSVVRKLDEFSQNLSTKYGLNRSKVECSMKINEYYLGSLSKADKGKFKIKYFVSVAVFAFLFWVIL